MVDTEIDFTTTSEVKNTYATEYKYRTDLFQPPSQIPLDTFQDLLDYLPEINTLGNMI